MTTTQLEHIAYRGLWKQGTYLCFEVAMPNLINGTRAMSTQERVDLLSYSTNGNWRFYEIKVSRSDFYSKCKLTFRGNFNYFILPQSLYEQVKQDIPSDIGCYIVTDKGNFWCEKKAKRKPLSVDKTELMFNFMQALSREYQKWRKYLEATQ